MAIRNIVESDISGKPDAATVTFGLGDTWFEIDLTDEERGWVDDYHAQVVDVVGRLLEGDELAWLEEACRALEP